MQGWKLQTSHSVRFHPIFLQFQAKNCIYLSNKRFKDLILNFARFLNGLTAEKLFVNNNKKCRKFKIAKSEKNSDFSNSVQGGKDVRTLLNCTTPYKILFTDHLCPMWERCLLRLGGRWRSRSFCKNGAQRHWIRRYAGKNNLIKNSDTWPRFSNLQH